MFQNVIKLISQLGTENDQEARNELRRMFPNGIGPGAAYGSPPPGTFVKECEDGHYLMIDQSIGGNWGEPIRDIGITLTVPYTSKYNQSSTSRREHSRKCALGLPSRNRVKHHVHVQKSSLPWFFFAALIFAIFIGFFVALCYSIYVR